MKKYWSGSGTVSVKLVLSMCGNCTSSRCVFGDVRELYLQAKYVLFAMFGDCICKYNFIGYVQKRCW